MNGNVPLLGQSKPRIGSGLGAIPRHLDEHGTFEAEGMVQGPNGQMIGAVRRTDYLDAEELIEAVSDRVLFKVMQALIDAGVVKAKLRPEKRR